MRHLWVPPFLRRRKDTHLHHGVGRCPGDPEEAEARFWRAFERAQPLPVRFLSDRCMSQAGLLACEESADKRWLRGGSSEPVWHMHAGVSR
ncbi:hypothetical protein AAFF_G00196030 [Aldrovandia affinis]|uniref:Uncharacterized protein n=1 Tax=Aldrovandia affinis TaxID=143900 RepID=A0AAD7R2D6_9TELE|nr:hypothetical protein AAFF_G00196030 [Aldrovandia affinis]